jgi:predicted DNA-binding transcriptional regulator YafY
LKLELTEQEAASILEMADCTLKTHGIRAMGAANMVINKINAAKQAEVNEKVSDIADAQSASPG